MKEITIGEKGKEIHGAYTVHGGLITVYRTGATTQVGGTPAEALAKILLREMVEPYIGQRNINGEHKS